jgi:hypothetical protein
MRLAMPRPSGPVLAALLVLALVVRAGIVANRTIDPDESQHLHVAWLVGQGQVPSRDFWEHHLPAFHYLLAPLTVGWAERPGVYFAARTVMVALTAVSVWLTVSIARRLSPDAACWAVTVLVFLPQFAETSTETRPDVAALVVQLGGLLALVRWRSGSRGAGWVWAAGAMQGVGLMMSLKALYGVVGAGVAVALGGRSSDTASPGSALLRFATGAAAGPAVLLGWLGWHGGRAALEGLFVQAIRGSLNFVDYAKTWPALGSEIGVFLLAGLGLAAVLREHGRGVLWHPVHGTLLPPAAVTAAALGLPWTPAVYQHAWLPLLPTVAVYAGLAAARLGAWARGGSSVTARGLVLPVLALALAVPAAESVTFAVREQNAAQLGRMAEMLRLTCPGEAVLDGTALYVFRPAAYRYGVLITGVREWVARGVIAEETLEADMRAARARVAYVDRRVRGMIGPVATFLARHYVPAENGLLLAGARIAVPPGRDGGRAAVDLLVPGIFRLTAGPRLHLAIDGVPAGPGWIDLEAGRHQLTWVGGDGQIALVAASCAERRAATTRAPR